MRSEVSWGRIINYQRKHNMTYYSQHKWYLKLSIFVLLSCKHSLMLSRISSNYFIIPAWADVCSSGGSNGTRPFITTRRAQLRPSDPVTLILALTPMKETDFFPRKKIHLHIREDGCSTYFWKIFHRLYAHHADMSGDDRIIDPPDVRFQLVPFFFIYWRRPIKLVQIDHQSTLHSIGLVIISEGAKIKRFLFSYIAIT